MTLQSIIDIDPNSSEIKGLSAIAASFGISDMVDAVVQVASLVPNVGKQMAFVIDETNASETIATFISLAAMNYASWANEIFEIEGIVNDEDELVTFPRSTSAESHKSYADQYFQQANTLIEKYFPSNPAA